MKTNKLRSGRYAAVFKGKKILLRAYRVTDLSRVSLASTERRPLLNRFDEILPIMKDKSRAQFNKRLSRYRKNWQDHNHFILGIFEIESGAFIGQIDLFTINKQLRWANLGYHIVNTHWGKGFASEAAWLALQVAFNQLNFHRIEAATERKNIGSSRVALNAGLQPEGSRRKFFPDNGGIDLDVFATNAIDFKKRGRK